MSENKFLENNKLVQKGKRGIFSVIFGRTTLILLLLLLQCALMVTAISYLGQYFYIAFGGFTLISAVNMMFILNTDDDPTIKLSWCILIGIVPIFGIFLYWFARKDLGHRVEKRVMADVISESMAYVPEQKELMEQMREENPPLYNLARYTGANGGYVAYGHTGVRYFTCGEEKLEALLTRLREAKSFIFMEYFIINKGSVWDEVLEILAQKAAEGVEVRIIYDGTLTLAALPHDYPKKLEKLGIKCKVFSPLYPFISVSYNNRDHRKIVVVDGEYAFTGGINLADEYMNRKTVYGHWKDTAVEISGRGVYGFTLMFLQMWNVTEREHIYEPYLKQSGNVHVDTTGVVIPYADSPLDHENVGKMVYLDIINRAERYVYIMTPYLILDNDMITALTFAAKRGVDVRILLPHIPDKKYAFALAKTHYKQLHKAGVHLYEYTPGFVHAKVFASDDVRGVVGTINLDYRSLYLHFECAAYMEGVSAVLDILKDFEQCFAQSQEVTDETIKHTAIWYKMFGPLLKLIAPLM
jgi:cardiolipin synthase